MCQSQAAADDAVEEDNFRSGPVFISDACGDNAAADAEQKVSGCCMAHNKALVMLLLALACSDVRPQFGMTDVLGRMSAFLWHRGRAI